MYGSSGARVIQRREQGASSASGWLTGALYGTVRQLWLAPASDRDGGMPDRGAAAEAAEWYDATWNPTLGCSPISLGCDHCDAMRVVAQLARMGGKAGARYNGLTRMARGGAAWTGMIRVREDLLSWPLFRRDPRRVLVGPMTDLFHADLGIAVLDRVHAVVTVADWHRFLVLTKRSERMRSYYADPRTPQRIALEIEKLAAWVSGEASTPPFPVIPHPDARTAPARRARALRRWQAGLARVEYSAAGGGPIGVKPWPLPNLWLGVSVEDQDRMDRVRDLIETPAALRWACFEPLLGPVRPDAMPLGEGRFDPLLGMHSRHDAHGRWSPAEGPALPPLDWVVAGGEIGAMARPAQADWLRLLRDQCVEAGVPFFFKQWGEFAPASQDGFGERMVRVGRRAAGRLLDGRSWNQTPDLQR